MSASRVVLSSVGSLDSRLRRKSRESAQDFENSSGDTQEAQGGHAKAAGAVLHRLAAQVAAAEGTPEASVRERLFQQLAVAIARGNAMAVRRRCEPVPHVSWPLRATHAALQVDP